MVRRKKEGANWIDGHVGRRLRTRRNLLGMSQEQMAAQLGLTFQQVQKYENGKNRVASGRLYQIAQILRVPVSYFFDGLDGAQPGNEPDPNSTKRETLELVRYWYKIPQGLRGSVMQMITKLGDSRALADAAR